MIIINYVLNTIYICVCVCVCVCVERERDRETEREPFNPFNMKADTTIIPTLQKWKLRHKEINLLLRFKPRQLGTKVCVHCSNIILLSIGKNYLGKAFVANLKLDSKYIIQNILSNILNISIIYIFLTRKKQFKLCRIINT